jgi:hypothetical protein
MRMVVFQDGEEEFVLRVLDGFDDEAVIAREVEGARFAWGAEFGEDVFEGEGGGSLRVPGGSDLRADRGMPRGA